MTAAVPVSFRLDPNADGLQLLRDWMASADEVGGYPQRLGCRPVEAREGCVRIVCDIDLGHANFIGLIHGGVTASMIDMAGGGAVMSVLTPGQTLVTTDLTMRFLNAAPIGSRRLEAKGTITYRDDRKAVVDCVATTEDGTVVAQGTVGVAIRPAR